MCEEWLDILVAQLRILPLQLLLPPCCSSCIFPGFGAFHERKPRLNKATKFFMGVVLVSICTCSCEYFCY